MANRKAAFLAAASGILALGAFGLAGCQQEAPGADIAIDNDLALA